MNRKYQNDKEIIKSKDSPIKKRLSVCSTINKYLHHEIAHANLNEHLNSESKDVDTQTNRNFTCQP